MIGFGRLRWVFSAVLQNHEQCITLKFAHFNLVNFYYNYFCLMCSFNIT